MSKTVFLLFLISFVAISKPTAACRCMIPTLCGDYNKQSTASFVRATPVFKTVLTGSSVFSVLYVLRITTVYKGCYKSKYAVVRTSSSSAACGANLTLFQSYVLPLSADSIPIITSCQFIRPYSTLSKADVKFLDTRTVCCGKTCRCADGSDPVRCTRAPCDYIQPPCKEATKCVDNYCGGCNIDWFTSAGEPACSCGTEISGLLLTARSRPAVK